MLTLPHSQTLESGEHVTRVARSRPPAVSLEKVVADFSILPHYVVNLVQNPDIEVGVRRGVTAAESAAGGVPGALSCRVLKLCRAPYHRSVGEPVGEAEKPRQERVRPLPASMG